MTKKLFLASAIVVGTMSTFATSTTSVLADEIDNSNTNSTVLVGPEVKKSDNTVALNSAVVQASSVAEQVPIVQAANASAAQQLLLNS